DVLVEIAPEAKQRPPQRLVVGHRVRPADGTEEDGFMAADLRGPVVGHHLAVLGVVIAAPVEVVPLKIDAEAPRRGVQHAQAFGHHFLADAIAGNDCDLVLVSCHRCSPVKVSPARPCRQGRREYVSRLHHAPLHASAFSLSLYTGRCCERCTCSSAGVITCTSRSNDGRISSSGTHAYPSSTPGRASRSLA